MFNSNLNQNIRVYRRPQDEQILETARKQNEVTDIAVSNMSNTGHEIWRESPGTREARFRRNAVIQKLEEEADRGCAQLDRLKDTYDRREQDRQQDQRFHMEGRRQIGTFTLSSIAQSLRGYMDDSAIPTATGGRNATALCRLDERLRAIDATVSRATDAQMLDTRHQHELALLHNEQIAADSNLFFDLLERHIRIKEQLLNHLTDEFREECELKFRIIERAIDFVKTVQDLLQGYAQMTEEQKDKDSARRDRETQRIEAEKRAMGELNMSQEEARRAATLLDNKENHAYALKREELAMEKCRDQQEHARRMKRYFSVWGILFG